MHESQSGSIVMLWHLLETKIDESFAARWLEILLLVRLFGFLLAKLGHPDDWVAPVMEILSSVVAAVGLLWSVWNCLPVFWPQLDISRRPWTGGFELLLTCQTRFWQRFDWCRTCSNNLTSHAQRWLSEQRRPPLELSTVDRGSWQDESGRQGQEMIPLVAPPTLAHMDRGWDESGDDTRIFAHRTLADKQL